MTPSLPSIVLGVAAASASGVVGSFALMKRMTLAGDVISHLALPGLGLAFLWGINPLVGAGATLAIGILLIHQLQKRSGLATETAIGVVFVAALAIGTLLTPAEDLIDALFGDVKPVTAVGSVIGLLGCAVVMVTLFLLRHRLILIIFSPDLAASLGINVQRANLIYLATFGVAVLLGLHFLGALLVGAMIIVPAATGRQLAKTLDQFLVASCAVSIGAFAIGYFIAAQWHLTLAPVIVAVASVMFGLSLFRRA